MPNENTIAGLQMQAGMIQGVLGELRDNSIALSSVSSDLKNLRDHVALISKIVKDGNGQPALTSQCATLQEAVSNLEADLKDIKEKQDEYETERMKDDTNRRGQKIQFYGTLVPAVLALIASVLTLILK